ncbi:hypothetical protein CA7LBN_004832 [Candidozyma auris]|uniref:Mso1 N-terminal domain-containing protein n=1 Tax=Candidozyma auris TaxID=498019 RepID=A0A8F3AIJ8_CANAR|nr:hypothetical protein CA7LBN_004832 [[Candida] auris]
MSQYQPNAAPGKSLISKINSKFSNMSITSHVEKDGSTEDDTLIHNAFVKFFDSQNQGYPEWLGVRNSTSAASQQSRYGQPDYSQSKYQPVRASYNSNYSPQESASTPPAEDRPAYTRRSNSKLQDMYQRSRASAGSSGSPSTPGRSTSTGASTARSTAAGQRLREKMMNGPSTRPTWGKN